RSNSLAHRTTWLRSDFCIIYRHTFKEYKYHIHLTFHKFFLTNGTIIVMEGQYDGIYDVLLRNTVSYTWYCSIAVYYGWVTKN
ncbi:hypothetical protein PTB13_27140, partial [Bacillus sp. MHSD17]|nr:hypothetical protein [Bacillus sp. MHSD17]